MSVVNYVPVTLRPSVHSGWVPLWHPRFPISSFGFYILLFDACNLAISALLVFPFPRPVRTHTHTYRFLIPLCPFCLASLDRPSPSISIFHLSPFFFPPLFTFISLQGNDICPHSVLSVATHCPIAPHHKFRSSYFFISGRLDGFHSRYTSFDETHPRGISVVSPRATKSPNSITEPRAPRHATPHYNMLLYVHTATRAGANMNACVISICRCFFVFSSFFSPHHLHIPSLSRVNRPSFFERFIRVIWQGHEDWGL